ncbi:MAG: OmpA family protein [Gammaproteobacteria bacterium]|jgi:OOP family OmpA-OmpF porin
MKNQYHVTTIVSTLAAGLLLANSVLAHEAGTAGEGYVGDAQHHYIIDSSGNCVRTGSWKPEDKTVDCGAEPPMVKAPPPPPPPAPVYETVTLSAKALFDFDKSNLKPEGKAALDAVADKIRAKGASVVDIDIIGHTDSIGTEEYNQDLSLRRATSVRDYIVSMGVDPSIIDVSGRGELEPVASNATKEGRAQNRRVDVRIGVRKEVVK